MGHRGQNEFVFLPLGGVGEIGMNLAAYGFGPQSHRRWLVVDMGVSFAGPDLPGVDLIFPDIEFLEKHKNDICGVVITHAHEDHYGAILDLAPRLEVPIYCTAFTAGLLEAKAGSSEAFSQLQLMLFKPGEKFTLGPYEIETLCVAHSIPEPVSLAISTPLGTVIHSADWKIDEHPLLPGAQINKERFCALGKKGILALICDSTNALREGHSGSESVVAPHLSEIIAHAKGRVAVTTFSSNIGRIRSIALAAQEANRKVFLLGRSMKRCVAVATDLGYLEGIEPFLTEAEYMQLGREEVVIIVTGSQGESRSALTKIARQEMQNISLSEGDMVIYSSKNIPGNERAILDIQNLLIDRGIEVVTSGNFTVHVSGHAKQEELKEMYGWVNPEILVPVHGEAAHLAAHKKLAEGAGIKKVLSIRDGDMLKLAPGEPMIVDKVEVTPLYKDGHLIGKRQELGIKERLRLSYVGHVVICIRTHKKHKFSEVYDLLAYGLPKKNMHGECFEEALFNAVSCAIENLPTEHRKDEDVLKKVCEKTARSYAEKAWGKKPVVSVFVMTLC